MGDRCNNGVVGVQDYGRVTGRVLDAMTNRPIPDAMVSVGSLFVSGRRPGGFMLAHVPVGFKPSRHVCRALRHRRIAVARRKKIVTAQAGYMRLVPIIHAGGQADASASSHADSAVTIVPHLRAARRDDSPLRLSPTATPSPSAAPSMQAQSGQIEVVLDRAIDIVGDFAAAT